MAKDGSKIVKIAGKKKIAKYTKADCQKELERLANDNSKYKDHVKERLSTL